MNASKENTTANFGINQESMDVSTVFRNLATGKYMKGFDYIATNFTFKAVYHTNAYSYCFCHCAFEHERIDYSLRPGEINEKSYERVLRCILDGKCEHVDDVPQEYIRETRVYAIHIAVAAGTLKPLEDYTDPTRKEYGDKKRYGHILVYRWLYQFDPYQVALVKNWESFLVPQLSWFVYDHDWQEHEKLCYLDARKIDIQEGNKVVQMHFMTCLELCVRNKNIQVLKRYIDTIFEDNPIHMIKALQLAFKDDLDELAGIILHYKKWISEGLRYGKGYKWIKQICELSILYDKPTVLDELLEEMMTQMSWRVGRGVDSAKQEAISLVERLIQLCNALKMKATTAVVLRFYRKLKGDMIDENCTLTDIDIAKLLGMFLIKRNLPVEKCIAVLKSVPNVSEYINHPDDTGNCLHAFNYFMVYEHRRRTTFLKHLLDLGASVNAKNKAGMTPLVHLMNIKMHRKYPHPREAEELYIYQNPDMVVHTSVFSCAVKSDQIFLKYKHDSIAGGFMVCWDYLMDGKLHGMAGHDEDAFPLNFLVPFLIEAGFRVSQSERMKIESAMETLHPAEQEYLKYWLNNPRPLKQQCRDVLRRHFNGLEIHRYVKTVNIPQTVTDFILLKPLLRCVSKELLD